jgi:hypothetical protein
MHVGIFEYKLIKINMGTRNLTMVVSNGQTKIAQYGQWDGYPSGQGVTALNFLRSADMKSFKEKVDNLKWLTPEQETAINEVPNWAAIYPYLSRDMAADILEYITKNDVIGLMNKEAFAGDGLFCEYGYVVDLDKQTFEVYQGFGHGKLSADERFSHLEGKQTNSGDYYAPIRLMKLYKLSELPTEDEFVSDLEGVEEEE